MDACYKKKKKCGLLFYRYKVQEKGIIVDTILVKMKTRVFNTKIQKVQDLSSLRMGAHNAYYKLLLNTKTWYYSVTKLRCNK